MNKTINKKAYNDFKKMLKKMMYENRNDVSGEFESIFYKIIEESAYVLKEKSTLYRSRIYTEDDKFDLLNKNKKKRYKAYDRVNSYINLNGISRENRMNPQGVRCVYLSSDIATSIMEVEPNIDDVISVAKIEVKQDLKIVNLSHIFTMLDDEYDRYISLYTQLEISRDSFDIKYVFPQYIGQLCKKLGYDGIAYKSKYRNNGNVADDVGINFAIYSYKKCAPISSYPYEILERKIVLYDRKDNVSISNNITGDILGEYI